MSDNSGIVRRHGAGHGERPSLRMLKEAFIKGVLERSVGGVNRSLETTRRYALPTQADREAAVELAGVDG